mmetsp:Transcript_4214/g.5918  ORF Transcript_4214/g.5918 Transcript_4214/m.5918 type:complete len:611 (-) Transcript_4214:334-2166(-)
MHNTCLDEIIRIFRARLGELGVELKHVIIWTDNAPHQYRCRQTFIQVASIQLRHPGITVTHRLAVVDNFKGIHDAVGKDPSRIVRELEKMDIRSPTAFMVFVNCIQHLETYETKWDELERENDIGIQLKGRFGLNERTMYFVTEKKEDYDRLVAQYPGRILLCDRTNIQDTISKKAVDDTMQLHEVKSFETSLPEAYQSKGKNKLDIRNWRVLTSYLPCNCFTCLGSFSREAVVNDRVVKVKVTTAALEQDIFVRRDVCQYKEWCKARVYTMKSPIHQEPTQHISLPYLERNEVPPTAPRKVEEVAAVVPPVNDNADDTASSTPSDEGAVAAESNVTEEASTRVCIDLSLIEPLIMLSPSNRATATKLLNMETNDAYNLRYDESPNEVQHGSLKLLRPELWLNDEVINGFSMNYLAPKLRNGFIFKTHFMSQLLNTGTNGRERPTYTYSNVKHWSRRIECGLFKLDNLYIPINHQNVHWLTMRVNFKAREISLWDSAGMNYTNTQYIKAALQYLGDEYMRADDEIKGDELDVVEWMKTWTTADLSFECPQQDNDYDCGVFHLLNLCLLVEAEAITEDAYSQASINAKDVRKTIAYILWRTSSNRSSRRQA